MTRLAFALFLALILPANVSAVALVSEPLDGYGPAQPVQSVPATGGIGTALVGGWATWYDDGPGLYAAVPWWNGTPTLIRVCATRCIVVTTRDFCACGERNGIPTVADLSRRAFARLAPLSQGIVEVTLEWPVELPATDSK